MIQIANAAPIEPNQIGEALSPLITNIVNPLLMLMFAVATVVFIYGIVRFMISGDVSDESRTQSKWAIFGGVIGMFIMISAWGIIRLVANTIDTI